jgi:hypothetical protein
MSSDSGGKCRKEARRPINWNSTGGAKDGKNLTRILQISISQSISFALAADEIG